MFLEWNLSNGGVNADLVISDLVPSPVEHLKNRTKSILNPPPPPFLIIIAQQIVELTNKRMNRRADENRVYRSNIIGAF